MKGQENHVLALHRWEKLRKLQQHYKDFGPFLEDVMDELGFGVTEQQYDIANYIVHGPQYLMVQAQRSQAKTTIAAAACVWFLIHSPHYRILIFSAGDTQATEISTLVVRIIMTMDVLACMRPDTQAGDRSSVEAFDVHHSLKGLDKSPSVRCEGIFANTQGARADILLADDVESAANSDTAVKRAKLLHRTLDFTSVCASGRIIWLGTPQSRDSIYNGLPARGVEVRVWPGRFPTADQMENYGKRLAPRLARLLTENPSLGTGGGLLGDQGQPTDPQLLDESKLQKKELDQGSAYFQLQHMLSTALTDAMRFPLKPELLTVVPATSRLPLEVVRGLDGTAVKEYRVGNYAFKLRTPHELSKETMPVPTEVVAYVDPAAGGANADETSYAIGCFLNGNVWALGAGAVPGGYERDKLVTLAERLLSRKPKVVIIEKNMGYGAFRAVFTQVLYEQADKLGVPKPGLEDDLVTGQKETRIINTLSPIMGRGALVITEAAVEEDARCCELYPPAVQESYSLFHQLGHMCNARDALLHDDRADALEGLCRKFQDQLVQDQHKQAAEARRKAHEQHVAELLRTIGGYRGAAPSRFTNTALRHRRR